MSDWVPLHVHSHFSLLDGLAKPIELAEVCEEHGYKSCAITDHGTLAGTVAFSQAMRDKGIKPILGCEFYICKQDATIKDSTNRGRHHLVVLAKNLKGWKQLMAASSRSNDEDVFYYKPRLDMEMLSKYTGDMIAFSGHAGSELSDMLFDDMEVYNSETIEEAEEYVVGGALELASKRALELQEIFGKGNFFIEIQLMDCDTMPSTQVAADILREVSKETGIPCVATCDAHYARRKDAVDQRVLLCSSLRTTFQKVNQQMARGERFMLDGFFRSENFEIPSLDRMEANHTDEELANSLAISDMCEDYSILGKPRLPHFECPDGLSETEYLKVLCREGWVNILVKYGVVKDDAKREEYRDRLLAEFAIIEEAGLEGYFLIVQDVVNWGRKQGWFMGPSRGSAGGSLVSYLLGITMIDPIPHDLLFSRFYNAGRNTDDHVSLPDIDIDFPINKRGQALEYTKNKYGHDNVCQMATFGSLQGRGALKEVLRVHDVCGYAMMNEITKHIPKPEEIADQLKVAEETSIIRWTLQHEPERLMTWCHICEDGSLGGEMAEYFEQAIRLEGTYKSQGKHSAGVVISADNLNEVCPMVRQKDGENKIAGLEMGHLEAMGHVKFDYLGVAACDKLMGVNSLLEYGHIT